MGVDESFDEFYSGDDESHFGEDSEEDGGGLNEFDGEEFNPKYLEEIIFFLSDKLNKTELRLVENSIESLYSLAYDIGMMDGYDLALHDGNLKNVVFGMN